MYDLHFLLLFRCYYYYARAYEGENQIAGVRGILHSRLRTATLRNDYEGQAVLINCILRSYISQNLYDQVIQSEENLEMKSLSVTLSCSFFRLTNL